MRDHHTGHAHFFNDVDQLELGLLTQFFVQRTQRLVQQQQFGLLGQAACQRHALLLPTRQLMWLALGKLAQLHQIEHFAGAPLNFVFGQAFALQAKGHVFPDIEVGEQGITLEHHVHRPVVRGQTRHVLTAQQNAPRRGLLEARQHAQQGGFATARTAQQCKNFALANRQAHLVHGYRFVEAFDEFLRFKVALAGHLVSGSWGGLVGHVRSLGGRKVNECHNKKGCPYTVYEQP